MAALSVNQFLHAIKLTLQLGHSLHWLPPVLARSVKLYGFDAQIKTFLSDPPPLTDLERVSNQHGDKDGVPTEHEVDCISHFILRVNYDFNGFQLLPFSDGRIARLIVRPGMSVSYSTVPQASISPTKPGCSAKSPPHTQSGSLWWSWQRWPAYPG